MEVGICRRCDSKLPANRCGCRSRKPRFTKVAMDMGGQIPLRGFFISPRRGLIVPLSQFGPVQPVRAFVEMGYERSKGPKVLSRSPLLTDQISFDPNRALLQFDHLLAVDTNTRRINGESVSVACGLHAAPTRMVVPGMVYGMRDNYVLCREYRDIEGMPEAIGWAEMLEVFAARGILGTGARVGLIVDSRLGDLNAINAREMSFCGDAILTENVSIIYASADVGHQELMANQFLALADDASKNVLREIEASNTLGNPLRSPVGKPYSRFRDWAAVKED